MTGRSSTQTLRPQLENVCSVWSPEISGSMNPSQRTLIGGLDQFSDSTDLLENSRLRERLKMLY